MSIPIQSNPLGINQNKRKDPLTFSATQANSSIKLTAIGNPVINELQYRTDSNGGWKKYNIDTVIPLENVGDYVQFQNTKNQLSSSIENYVQFVMEGKIDGSGNIQSLLNYSEQCKASCFEYLFRDCDSLIDASNLILSSKILNNACYHGMFANCKSLIYAPSLPATKLVIDCYYSMFYHCESLIEAPELPATVLAVSCYKAMFAGCVSLTETPELPATVLAPCCYQEMFSGCTSLTQIPNLSATILAEDCYQAMFYRCTSLVTPCELPATNLTFECYRDMFNSCTSLTSIPDLPAVTLAENCYWAMFSNCPQLVDLSSATISMKFIGNYSCAYMFNVCSNLKYLPVFDDFSTLSEYCFFYMFNGCKSLVETPRLSALTLAGHCYQNMFSECNSLTISPQLPAITLANYCYQKMFFDNENTQKIDVDFETWTNNGATTDWVKNVYQDGVFLKPENLSEEYGYSKIPINFKPFDKNKPLTLTADESSTIQITKSGNPSGVELYYNKNGSGWVSYSLNSVISLNANEYVQFKNTNSNYQFSTGRNDFYGFVMTGKIKASGNVQSLVNFSDTADWYAFRKLFQNCKSLVEAPTVLPAKHVLGYAYASMFGKTSITNMPIMLAEDFSDYACYYMFEECPINYAKILDKKGINGNRCFESMFNNCSNLKIIDVDFTTWTVDSDKDEHRNWVSGVSASGTFLKKQILNKTFATNRIPNNWNVYNPLKFIQATETQYINTNITPSENFEIEVCGAGLLNFGSRTNYLLNEFRFSIGVNQIDFAFGNDLYSYSKTGIGNEKYIIKYGTDGKFYVNNELIYSSSSSVSQYYPIYAFAINSNGTPIFNSTYPSQIFRIKMWRDGTLISDIIPVDNNGGCLFDKLNNICFSNNGTGNFVI